MTLSDLAQQACEHLKDPLPHLQRNGRETTSTTLHKKYYAGPLGRWENFEAKCHEVVRDNILPHRSRRSTESAFGYPMPEVYICGDELSVSGRFAEHALNPVIHALKENIPVQFGDFKASSESCSGKVPDIVMLGPKPTLTYRKATNIPIEEILQVRMVGEMKTPWMHHLDKMCDGDTITRLFGQIAEYMLALRMKYGFLTTYNQTIFLTQAQRAQDGQWVIYYSNPILHTTETVKISRKTTNLKDTISIRDCMAAVAWLAHEDSRVSRNDSTEKLVTTFSSKPNYVAPSKDETNKTYPPKKEEPLRSANFASEATIAGYSYDSSNSNQSSQSDTPRTSITSKGKKPISIQSLSRKGTTHTSLGGSLGYSHAAPQATKQQDDETRGIPLPERPRLHVTAHTSLGGPLGSSDPAPQAIQQRDDETRAIPPPERPRRQPQIIHLTHVGKDKYRGIIAGQYHDFGPRDLRKHNGKYQVQAHGIWHEATIHSDTMTPDEKERSKKTSKPGGFFGSRRQ
ncbi:hypothetical protein FQN50_009357 [Emmonsiellopsis sp. PD_5]|nr:hypothetical protein FQN50_009357 [Emmonsiellopsis sp. PD_5]